VPYLDVSATYDAVRRVLFVNVLNRSKETSISTRVEERGGALARDVLAWEMNYPDLKGVHAFGDDEKIRPTTRSIPTGGDGQAFGYTFPAHSLTILQFGTRQDAARRG
jgi:alpha-L-arabinofuranosidase